MGDKQTLYQYLLGKVSTKNLIEEDILTEYQYLLGKVSTTCDENAAGRGKWVSISIR